jgi:hypothetical protein
MLCGSCGVPNAESANFCNGCGSQLARAAEVSIGFPQTVLTETPPFFYSCSPIKLFVLSGLSCNLYTIYWFWRQWRTDDPSEGRGSILFKTLMSPFFFYSMANQVKEEAERKEVACRYSPTVLAGVLLGTVIAIELLPDPVLLAMVWLVACPVIFVQRTINDVNAAVSRQRDMTWRRWEVAVAVVFGLFWLMVIVGALLPEQT